MHGKNPAVTFGVVLRFTVLSNFVELFVPGGLDVVRVYALSRASGDLALSFSSVLVERMIGLLTLLLIVLVGLVAGPPGLRAALGYLAGLGLALLLLGCLALLQPTLRAVTERLISACWLAPVQRRLVKLYAHLDAYADQPILMIKAVFMAFAMHALRIATTMMAAWSLGIELAWITWLIIVPIAVFVAQLPISVGGIGVRELTFVSLLALVGVPAEAAFTLSLLLYALRFACFLPAAAIVELAGQRLGARAREAEQAAVMAASNVPS